MITEYDGYDVKIVENPSPEMIKKSQDRVCMLKEKMEKRREELRNKVAQ